MNKTLSSSFSPLCCWCSTDADDGVYTLQFYTHQQHNNSNKRARFLFGKNVGWQEENENNQDEREVNGEKNELRTIFNAEEHLLLNIPAINR
jgi:hypothetical protein